MAAGFSVGAVCYATTAQAVDAYYSTLNPVSASISSTVTLYVDYSKTSGAWRKNTYQINSGGDYTLKTSTAVPSTVYGDCTTINTPSENFTDGLLLGWGVAAAMVAAYAIHLLRRALI